MCDEESTGSTESSFAGYPGGFLKKANFSKIMNSKYNEF